MTRHFSKLAAGASLAMLVVAMPVQAQEYPEPTPLSEGEARTGTLTRESPRMYENDYYLDLYEISGEAGERVEITMQSDEFDTLVEIGRLDEYGFNQLAMDDDGAGELNSRLVYTFPETGSYVVRARTYGANTTGNYSIQVNHLPPPPPPPPPTRIRRGQTIEGTLSENSPSYEADDYGTVRHYDLYSLQGRAGDTVTVTLRSIDFDSFLEVGGMTPFGFAVADSNDDGMAIDEEEPLGLDSRLTATFVQDGTMIIRATTLGGGNTGGYALTVE